jgi:polar amino acid transport system substrate-binding protein
MKNVRIRCVAFVLFAAPLAALALDAPHRPLAIAICDDENEWPPYSYYQRIDGKKTPNLAGFAIDVVHYIFSRHDVRYTIDLIPWTRCMAVASLGKEYGMVLNLSYNAERNKRFLLSRPYYATTSYYYYSRRNHPKGLAIHKLADLKQYRVCGIQGYNYEGYGMAAGEVDQGARSFPALISKVKLGRCSLFVEKNEIMNGYSAIGKNYLADRELGRAPIPGMKPDLFYLGISRRAARAAELRRLIDAELQRMEASGKLNELLKKSSGVSAH